MLGLVERGKVSVHTPSTGSDYEAKDVFDACVVIGSGSPDPCVATIPVVASDFASEGFFALIGWTILERCFLVCDGPARVFTLSF